MHNIELGKEGSPKLESSFGFNIETCCGSIPQSNNWDSSWTVRDCFVITCNWTNGWIALHYRLDFRTKLNFKFWYYLKVSLLLFSHSTQPSWKNKFSLQKIMKPKVCGTNWKQLCHNFSKELKSNHLYYTEICGRGMQEPLMENQVTNSNYVMKFIPITIIDLDPIY